MPLNLGHQLAYIKQKDPKLGDAMQQIVDQLNQTLVNTGTDSNGDYPAPSRLQNIQVAAANGVAHIQITDNAKIQKGVNYFLEHDTDPSFPRPYVVDLGASRTHLLPVGDSTFYFRAYHQYPGSKPSEPLVLGGSNPTAIAGGGAALPTLFPSTGSGTASGDGQQGGSGLGLVLFRPTTGPLRPSLK